MTIRADAFTVRAATWNVHGCVGRDGIFAPGRTAAILRDLDADILALQEVDSRTHLTNGLDTFAFLRDRLLPHAFEARALSGGAGHYGQMVLSRWPLARGRIHDISTARREPRKVIEAHVQSPRGSIRVLATHLGLSVGERRLQVRALGAILDRVPGGPTVVLGDFNELRRRGSAHRAFAGRLASAPARATFPSAAPVLALDRIWYEAPLQGAWSRTVREAREASDHLPLVAEMRWPDGGGTIF